MRLSEELELERDEEEEEEGTEEGGGGGMVDVEVDAERLVTDTRVRSDVLADIV